MKKRAVALLLSASFLFCSCFYSTAVDAEPVSSVVSAEALAVKIASIIPDKQFGGLYFDDSGVLNVNVVSFDPTVSLDAINALNKNANQIVYHQVNYSLEYLNAVADMLVPLMSALDIMLLDANDITNQVDVVFASPYDDSDLAQIFEISGVSQDSDVFYFSVAENNVSVEMTVGTAPPLWHAKFGPF